MRSGFILSCESTIDLPYSYCEQRDIPVLFYSYQVDGVSYEDDMGRDPEALPQFYGFLDAGKLPSTAQLNEFQYETFFDALLQQGDVLHIAFGSGMTASVQNAMLAAETLREKYPERKLTVIDSLCSSSGYGLLVDGAADLRDEGISMDEIADWVLEKRQKVHHQFYSTELKFYRRSGRMSGAAAAIGTVLGICPIMRLDDKGRIIAYDKVRGKKNAVARTVETMKRHAENGEELHRQGVYLPLQLPCGCRGDEGRRRSRVSASERRGAHLRYRHDCRVAFRPWHRRGILLWRRPLTGGFGCLSFF